MIGLDTIRVTKKEGSNLDLSKVKKFLEEKLETPKSSKVCVGWYDKEKDEIKLVLKNPVSLDKIHQILHAFQTERIKIKEFTWRENETGPIRRGTIDIIVS